MIQHAPNSRTESPPALRPIKLKLLICSVADDRNPWPPDKWVKFLSALSVFDVREAAAVRLVPHIAHYLPTSVE